MPKKTISWFDDYVFISPEPSLIIPCLTKTEQTIAELKNHLEIDFKVPTTKTNNFLLLGFFNQQTHTHTGRGT